MNQVCKYVYHRPSQPSITLRIMIIVKNLVFDNLAKEYKWLHLISDNKLYIQSKYQAMELLKSWPLI